MTTTSLPEVAARPAARRPLTRDLIVDEAVALIDELGLADLTMRRLGRRLGVEAMSLYRYVDGREALLDGVVERVTGALQVDPPTGGHSGWQPYLHRLAHEVRTIALQHPRVFPLVATRHPDAPWLRPPLRSLDLVEAFLEGLISRGFSDAGAVASYRAFSGFLLGHLLLESAALGAGVVPLVDGDGAPLPGADGGTPDAHHAGPSAAPDRGDALADHPHLRRLRGSLTQDESAADFEEALEHLLRRLERHAG